MTLLKLNIPVEFRKTVNTNPQTGEAYVVRGKIDFVVTAENTKAFSAGDNFVTTL